MPLETGVILNQRYRIVQALGIGGFGAVYLAIDETFGTQCALKENLSLSPESERQFKREAALLATLRHKNLPRVTNHFILDNKQYLVMDFVEGDDLRTQLAQSGPLPEATVVRWAAQICNALSYLHQRNPPVLHRDIKPANLKLTAEGEVMLVDFGLAKAGGAGQKTTTGATALTPGFAPPEQYGMGQTDARTDQYALAATLYNLLTGQVPPEAMSRLIGEAPLKPPEAFRPDLSPHVAETLKRALELVPTNRFTNIAEFKEAMLGNLSLAAIKSLPNIADETDEMDYGSVPTPPPPTVEATRPPQRLGWIGILGVVVLLAIGLGYYLYGRPAAPPAVIDPTAPITVAPSLAATAVNQVPLASPTKALLSEPTQPVPEATLVDITLPSFEAALIAQDNIGQLTRRQHWDSATTGPALFELSPDGQFLAVPGREGLDVFDLHSGQVISTWHGFLDGRSILELAYLPEGLILIQMPNEIYRRNVWVGEREFTYRSIKGDGFAASADGHYLAVKDRVFTTFEVKTGSDTCSLGTPDVAYQYYQFTPDSTYFLLVSGQNIGWWNATTCNLEATVSGHAERPLKDLVFTPDGTRMAAASGDVWDVATHKLLTAFDAPVNLSLIALSPDGKLIVGNDGTVWSAETGQELMVLKWDTTVEKMQFTPDGKWLVRQMPGDEIELWAIDPQQQSVSAAPTAASGTPIPTRPAITAGQVEQLQLVTWWGDDPTLNLRLIRDNPLGEVTQLSEKPLRTSFSFMPNRQRLLVMAGGGLEQIDLATGQLVEPLSISGEIQEAVFSGDNFALVAKNGSTERWDLLRGILRQTYNDVGQYLIANPKGDAFALQNTAVQVVDQLSGIVRQGFGAGNSRYFFQFTPDGRYLALSTGQNVTLYDLVEKGQPRILTGRTRTRGLAFTADGKKLIAANGAVWDVASGKLEVFFESQAMLMAVSPDGSLLVGDDGWMWSATDGQRLGRLRDMRSPATQLAFTPDGQYLLWQTADEKIFGYGIVPLAALPALPPPAPNTIQSANIGQLTLQAQWGKRRVLSAFWSPDHQYLGVNTANNLIFYEADTMQVARVLWGETGLALNALGQAIVITPQVGLRLVEVTSGKTVKDLGYPGVTQVAFSADGKKLALGGQVTQSGKTDGVAVLDLETGATQILDDGKGRYKNVVGLAFTPDGKILVTTRATTVSIWDLTTGKLVRGNIGGVTLPAVVSPDGEALAYFNGQFRVERLLTGGIYRTFTAAGAEYFGAGQDVDPITPLSYSFLPNGRLAVFYRTRFEGALRLIAWGVEPSDPQVMAARIGVISNMEGLYVENVYYKDRAHPIPALALSADGVRFFSLTADGVARVWNAADGKLVAASQPDYRGRFILTSDGAQLLMPRGLEGKEQGFDFLDIASGKTLETLKKDWHPEQWLYVSRGVVMAVHPNGKTDTNKPLGRVTYLNMLDKTEFGAYSSEAFADTSYLATSPNGRLFAFWEYGGGRGFVQIFGLDYARPVHRFGPYNARTALVFLPNGRQIAFSNKNKIEIWNLLTGRLDQTLEGQGRTIGELAVTADGVHLVASTGEIWDLQAGQLVAKFENTRQAKHILISPNGEVLVGEDGTLWAVADGHKLGELPNLLGPAISMAFTPDGLRLIWQVSENSDPKDLLNKGEGLVQVWGIAP